MDQKTFSVVAGVIFALVALLHLLRIYMGWPVVIGSWTAPMWVSWIGLVVAGGLSYFGLKFRYAQLAAHLTSRQWPLLARLGRADHRCECPQFGVKQTCPACTRNNAHDPRTTIALALFHICLECGRGNFSAISRPLFLASLASGISFISGGLLFGLLSDLKGRLFR